MITTPSVILNDYRIGDYVTYVPLLGGMRDVRITDRQDDITHGRPGFDGVGTNGVSYWGYDSQIIAVRRPTVSLVKDIDWVTSLEIECVDPSTGRRGDRFGSSQSEWGGSVELAGNAEGLGWHGVGDLVGGVLPLQSTVSIGCRR